MDVASARTYLCLIDKRLELSDLNEDFLINVVADARSKYKVWAAVCLLRLVGTRKNLDTLKACCLRPIVDLQVTALFTIAKIAGSSWAEFYEELLTKKEYRQKWVAMSVLCQFGHAKPEKTVLTRAKQAAKRKRACPEYGTLSGKETEVTAALKYLERNQLFGGPTIRTIEKIRRDGSELTAAEQAALDQFLAARRLT